MNGRTLSQKIIFILKPTEEVYFQLFMFSFSAREEKQTKNALGPSLCKQTLKTRRLADYPLLQPLVFPFHNSPFVFLPQFAPLFHTTYFFSHDLFVLALQLQPSF